MLSRGIDNICIEAATLEDLPQLTDLLLDLFSIEEEFTPDPEKQLAGLRLILERPHLGRIFVLRSNKRIIGMVSLLITVSTALGGFALWLEDLIVHKDFRGVGLGSRLLSYAIDYAREKGFSRITLLTDCIAPGTLSFYEKRGFVKSGMIPMRFKIDVSSKP